MSITETRIKKQNQKRQKRSKRYTATVIGVSTLAIILTALIVGKLTITYMNTSKWDKTTINGKYADMPAEFAKNHVSADMIDDVNSLTKVNSLLNEIKADYGLNDNNIDDAKAFLDKANKILEHYGITGGEIRENVDDLALYIALYDAEQTFYSTPNHELLAQQIGVITNKIMRDNAEFKKSDNKILDRLNGIATDYANLASFLNEVYILGTIENDKLTVSKDITTAETNRLLNSIDELKLSQFPSIEKFATVLRGSDWTKILNNNTVFKTHEDWIKIHAAFNAVYKENYIKVSDIKSYKDAVDNQLTISLDDEKNTDEYEVLDSSSVDEITVNGEKVTSGYFNRYANVIVYVKASYKNKTDTTRETRESTTTSSSTGQSSDRVTIPSGTTSSSTEPVEIPDDTTPSTTDTVTTPSDD